MIIASQAALAQSAKPPAAVLELAAAYDKAIIEQDAAVYKRIFVDDFVLIDFDGLRISKAKAVEDAASGSTKLEVAKSTNDAYRIYGDTVIWTGDWHEKGTTNGVPFENKGPFTTVLKKIKGEWKIISDQVTRNHPRWDAGSVFGIHQFTLKKDVDVNEFEEFMRGEFATAWAKPIGGMRLVALKGNRGERTGKYAAVFYFESAKLRDKYFPSTTGDPSPAYIEVMGTNGSVMQRLFEDFIESTKFTGYTALN